MRNRIFCILLALAMCGGSIAQATAYYGRLYIPDVGIDVGLYGSEDRQAVVDRQDSACAFRLSYGRRTLLVADHNTQAFGPLLDVTEGMTGHIELKDGTIKHIICVEVLDGHNTGHCITDDHGLSVVGRHDYLMYTCMGYWRNVRICQWDLTYDKEGEDDPI